MRCGVYLAEVVREALEKRDGAHPTRRVDLERHLALDEVGADETYKLACLLACWRDCPPQPLAGVEGIQARLACCSHLCKGNMKSSLRPTLDNSLVLINAANKIIK